MCGRFETTSLTWKQIHDQLAFFARVTTAPLNLEPNGDVRPTTRQLVARIEDGEWTLEMKRWGLVPRWRSGKPLKDTSKGAGDGFKLTTFNARVENFAPSAKRSAVFGDTFIKRRCLVPCSGWFEWTGPLGSKTKHRFSRVDAQPV
jgi:putative SOS response-associated peptidase YedK